MSIRKELIDELLATSDGSLIGPEVCRRNPFSEAHFKTLKYRPNYPDRFGSIQDARLFCQEFFPWYNQQQQHSGLNLLIPADVHYGQAAQLISKRQAVFDLAYQAHPERFVRRPPTAAPSFLANRCLD